jgi:hypothetical protein
MERRHVWIPIPLSALLGAALGCAGGAAPAAQAPEPVATQAAPATAQPAPAAVQPAPAEQPGPAGQAAAAAPSPGKDPKAQAQQDANAASDKEQVFKLDRPPRELITAEDTAFEVNFTSSEIGERTEQQCRAQAGEDMQALTQCKREARDKFPVTIQRFVEKQGTWWWITYERRGKQLVPLHRIPIDFGEETANSVTILPKGKDQGLTPLSPLPRKVVINVPNSYSIQIQDPQHGMLSYGAKIGLVPSSH